MRWKQNRYWLIPLIMALAIKIFSFFPAAVERYYAEGLYPVISIFPRILFGWIPFSVGDVLYAAAFIYLVVSLVNFVSRAFRRTLHRAYLLLCLKRAAIIGLWIYLLFNIFWGLNYDRLPVATRLGLEVKPYNREDLRELVGMLVLRMNEIDSASRAARRNLDNSDSIFHYSIDAFHSASHQFPFLNYRFPSVKPSFYGFVANYMGFSGYYNPFTCEAQVNTTIPRFVQPFTTCHEIGHQMGFAKEEEANFCGFLTTKSSSNPAFRYSEYLDLYLYAATALYQLDSTAFIHYRESLHPAVRQDLRDLKAFYQRYQNPFEPIIHRIYGKYLKANRQPQGIYSYDEVVGLAIAWYRRNGASAF